MLDRRFNLHHTQKRVVKQWMTVLVAVIALTYISQPVQTPVNPCPESGCVVEYISKVHAVEPVLETYNAPQHIVDLIIQYFGDEAQNALKIVGTCENGKWNPTAVNHNRNGSTDHSIFQINSIHTKKYGDGFKTSVEENIRVASLIQKSSGWRAWACSEVIGIKPFWK